MIGTHYRRFDHSFHPSQHARSTSYANQFSNPPLVNYASPQYVFQPNHVPAQPSLDQSWFLDSGATHHLTANLQNLNIHKPYEGADQVLMGNGSGSHNRKTSSSRPE